MKNFLKPFKYTFLVCVLVHTALSLHGATNAFGAWFLPVDCAPRALIAGNSVLFTNEESSNGITAASDGSGGTQFILPNIGSYQVTVGILAMGGNNGFTINLNGVPTPPNFRIATNNRNTLNPVTVTLTTTKINSVLKITLAPGSNTKMCRGSATGSQAFISIIQVQ